jgi:hypothetical protein
MYVAASLVTGVFIGQGLLRLSGTAPINTRDGRLVANGVLAQALSEQLASTPKDDSPVLIGVTFKSKDGDYCRTFTLRDTTTLAGVACHKGDAWQVGTLAQTGQLPARTSPAAATYRQAGSAMPRAVTQAVEDMISGDTLDGHAEQLARDHNWNAR